jgi:hypothetical protein
MVRSGRIPANICRQPPGTRPFSKMEDGHIEASDFGLPLLGLPADSLLTCWLSFGHGELVLFLLEITHWLAITNSFPVKGSPRLWIYLGTTGIISHVDTIKICLLKQPSKS